MISVDGNMSGQSVSNSQVASAPLHQPPPPLATPMNVYPPSTMSNQPPVTNNTYTTNSNGQVRLKFLYRKFFEVFLTFKPIGISVIHRNIICTSLKLILFCKIWRAWLKH